MAKEVYIGVDDTARKVKTMYVGVNGVARKVKKSYVGVDGVAREVYSAAKRASEYAVGSTVYLLESGVAKEYIVVHQGLPSSEYDESCNGAWLLRKDCYGQMDFNVHSTNDYATSRVHSTLNNDFVNRFDENTKKKIKQVNIPDATSDGSEPLLATVFILSVNELGWTSADYTDEGSCLDYFSGCDATDSKRIVPNNIAYWTRSGYHYASGGVGVVEEGGLRPRVATSAGLGIRPALILDSNTGFDPDTNTIV